MPPAEAAAGPRPPMPAISRSFIQAQHRALPDLDLNWGHHMGIGNTISMPEAMDSSIATVLCSRVTTVGSLGHLALLHGKE